MWPSVGEIAPIEEGGPTWIALPLLFRACRPAGSAPQD